MYYAFNPRLTDEQVLNLYEQQAARNKEMWATIINDARKMPPAQAQDYLRAILPFASAMMGL